MSDPCSNAGRATKHGNTQAVPNYTILQHANRQSGSSINQSNSQPINQSNDRLNSQSNDRSNNQAFNRQPQQKLPARQPFDQGMNRPDTQTNRPLVTQPLAQPTDQSNNQTNTRLSAAAKPFSFEQTMNQSMFGSYEQGYPFNESINQPMNQPTNQTVNPTFDYHLIQQQQYEQAYLRQLQLMNLQSNPVLAQTMNSPPVNSAITHAINPAVNQSINSVVSQSNNQFADGLASSPEMYPLISPTAVSQGQSINQVQSNTQAFDHSINQANKQPAKVVASKQANPLVNQSKDQSIGQTNNQLGQFYPGQFYMPSNYMMNPFNQPINQAVNHPIVQALGAPNNAPVSSPIAHSTNPTINLDKIDDYSSMYMPSPINQSINPSITSSINPLTSGSSISPAVNPSVNQSMYLHAALEQQQQQMARMHQLINQQAFELQRMQSLTQSNNQLIGQSNNPSATQTMNQLNTFASLMSTPLAMSPINQSINQPINQSMTERAFVTGISAIINQSTNQSVEELLASINQNSQVIMQASNKPLNPSLVSSNNQPSNPQVNNSTNQSTVPTDSMNALSLQPANETKPSAESSKQDNVSQNNAAPATQPVTQPVVEAFKPKSFKEALTKQPSDLTSQPPSQPISRSANQASTSNQTTTSSKPSVASTKPTVLPLPSDKSINQPHKQPTDQTFNQSKQITLPALPANLVARVGYPINNQPLSLPQDPSTKDGSMQSIKPFTMADVSANARHFVWKVFSIDDLLRSIDQSIFGSDEQATNQSTNPTKKFKVRPTAMEDMDAAYTQSLKQPTNQLHPRLASPIFLYFTVRFSNEFVGVATMSGRMTNQSPDPSTGKWAQSAPLKWLFVHLLPRQAINHLKFKTKQTGSPLHNQSDNQTSTHTNKQPARSVTQSSDLMLERSLTSARQGYEMVDDNWKTLLTLFIEQSNNQSKTHFNNQSIIRLTPRSHNPSVGQSKVIESNIPSVASSADQSVTQSGKVFVKRSNIQSNDQPNNESFDRRVTRSMRRGNNQANDSSTTQSTNQSIDQPDDHSVNQSAEFSGRGRGRGGARRGSRRGQSNNHSSPADFADQSNSQSNDQQFKSTRPRKVRVRPVQSSDATSSISSPVNQSTVSSSSPTDNQHINQPVSQSSNPSEKRPRKFKTAKPVTAATPKVD